MSIREKQHHILETQDECVLRGGQCMRRRQAMLEWMRGLERQGMRFKPVGTHFFYGYWEKEREHE